MAKDEGIRVYLRLRPPATAQHSHFLGGGGGGGGAGSSQSNRKQGVNTASCDYYVENSFDGAKVHFHVDKKLDGDIVNNTSEDYAYAFRRVFEPSATQEDVFNVVAKDCVLSALQGYNSTIFAYGQTGSGKTYSITGGTESYGDRGIIPRSLGLIYEEMARQSEYVWNVSIAYLQIYNDKGQDLLNHGKDAKTLEDLPAVTVHEVDEGTTVLRNLEQHAAPTLADALNLLFLGDTNRLYCETPMNRTSSRSHCVFTVFIEARAVGSSVVRRSKLNLVDLAGSERVSKTGVDGTTLVEAKYINLSLHYLEHVIVALSEQAKGRRDHVPFRNSFMTMVLRDSLGGNCRTSMLATAHLAKAMLPETVSTCSFAQRVAQIKQHAKVNEEVDPLVLVAKLKAEVAQLKDQLAFYQRQQDGSADLDRELTEEEKLICRGLVDKYLNQTDPPQPRIEGFQGDLARIYYCFAIMKDIALGHPSGGTMAAASPGSSKAAAPVSEAKIAAYEEQISQLQISLQQRENEVNTMFELVSKAQGGARFNATTQTANRFDEQGNPIHDESLVGGGRGVVYNGVYTNPAAAAAVSGALARVATLSERGKLSEAEATAAQEYLRRKETVVTGGEGSAGDANGGTASNGGYNLAALSDAELVEDRAVAFEAFKQSYAQYAKVEAAKVELKAKYDGCKKTAAELNNTVDTIKSLKTQIQRLRAERAVEGVEEADPQETALMEQLSQQRDQYGALGASLRAQKETIDGMHAFMKHAQEQLTKDFEAWFAARKRQVTLAVNGPSGAAATTDQTTAAAPVVVPAKPLPVTAAPADAAGDGRVRLQSTPSARQTETDTVSASPPSRGRALPLGSPLGGSSPAGGFPMATPSMHSSALPERHPSSAPSSSTVPALARREGVPFQPYSSAVAASSTRVGPSYEAGASNGLAVSHQQGGWIREGGSATDGVDGKDPPRRELSSVATPPPAHVSSPLPLSSGSRNPYLISSVSSSSAVLAGMGSTTTAAAASHSARNHHLQPMSTPPPVPLASGGVAGSGATYASPRSGESAPGTAYSSPFPQPSLSASSAVLPPATSTAAEPRNPFAPEHRSTGNRAADEQLAALYKMRDAMRAQLP